MLNSNAGHPIQCGISNSIVGKYFYMEDLIIFKNSCFVASLRRVFKSTYLKHESVQIGKQCIVQFRLFENIVTASLVNWNGQETYGNI